MSEDRKLKRISKVTISEIERLYGKSTKAEIEQAEILLNTPEILASYYEDEEN